MATDVTRGEPAPAEVSKPDLAPVVPPQLPVVSAQPHRARFLVIYTLLGASLVAALVGVAVFAGRSINPAPSWSSWKPDGGGLGAAKQIAERVSGDYRLAGGQQLVDVIAKAPSVSPANQQIPIHYVAVRGKNAANDAIFPVSSSDSVMYSLCGLGSACAIEQGTPSVERGTLVRREILELALYTFKYVGGVNHVIAFMPPTPGNAPKYVIYLQKNDLQAQLKMPLVNTLRTKVPLPSAITPRETQTIDSVTESRVFSFTLSQAQQGDAILVLTPLAA